MKEPGIPDVQWTMDPFDAPDMAETRGVKDPPIRFELSFADGCCTETVMSGTV